jgi:hypothetical protein
MRVKLLKSKNMSLPNVSKMSLVEYVDFLESTALYTGVEAEELNMEYRFEIGLIGDEMYDRAKGELHRRDYMFAHYGEY